MAEGAEGEDEAPPEEECAAEFKPLVHLDEVEVQVRVSLSAGTSTMH